MRDFTDALLILLSTFLLYHKRHFLHLTKTLTGTTRREGESVLGDSYRQIEFFVCRERQELFVGQENLKFRKHLRSYTEEYVNQKSRE